MTRSLRLLLGAALAVAVLPPVPAAAKPTPASAAPSSATRFGVIASTIGDPGGNNLANTQALYGQHRTLMGGGPTGIRVFSAGNIPLATDTTVQGQFLAWIAANHPDEYVTVSFKTYSSTRQNTLMTWAQTNSLDLELIFFHEPQDDCFKIPTPSSPACPANYKSVYVQMDIQRDAHAWASRVVLNKNLMDYWQHFESAKKGGGWPLYVEPKNGAGEKTDPADMVTWDLYSAEWLPLYYSTSRALKYPDQVWDGTAMPWGYGELGAHRNPDDAEWSGLADFEQRVTDAAQDPEATYPGLPPAVFVKWWCAYGAAGVAENNHLERSAAAVAHYRAKVIASPL